MKTIRDFGKVCFILLLVMGTVIAQRFGYVDSQQILEKMPEYKAAMQSIEQISKQWQDELDKKYQQIEKMYEEYRAKEPLLSDQQKREFQDRIIKAEEEARQFQKEHFGYEGKLFKLREEKMKPIMDKLLSAIESYAKEKRINVILDKSAAVVFLYADPTYDYTQKIIQRLGLK